MSLIVIGLMNQMRESHSLQILILLHLNVDPWIQVQHSIQCRILDQWWFFCLENHSIISELFTQSSSMWIWHSYGSMLPSGAEEGGCKEGDNQGTDKALRTSLCPCAAEHWVTCLVARQLWNVLALVSNNLWGGFYLRVGWASGRDSGIRKERERKTL